MKILKQKSNTIKPLNIRKSKNTVTINNDKYEYTIKDTLDLRNVDRMADMSESNTNTYIRRK